LIIQQQEYEKVIKALSSFNCGLFKDKNLIKVSLDKTFSFDIIFKYDLDTRFKYLKDFIERLCTKKVKDSLFEAKFILPDREDIAFIELIELAKNIKNNTSFNSMVLSLMKLKFLIENKKDFSWEKVINTARETRTGVQLKLSAMFISDIVPDIIPDVLRDDNLFDKETIEYYNWVKFRKIYNEKVRHDYKEYTLIFLFKSIYENLKILINVFRDCALNIINFIKGLFYFVFGILNVTKNILLCFAKYFHAKIRFIYCKLIKNNSVLTAKYVNKVEKEPESET
jgi:hypothetical protein